MKTKLRLRDLNWVCKIGVVGGWVIICVYICVYISAFIYGTIQGLMLL